MPRYDYQCPKCGKVQEEIHRMNETPEVKCSECGVPMKKLIGAPAFKVNGYFTAKSGYAKNKEYMEAVEKKNKMKEGKIPEIKTKST